MSAAKAGDEYWLVSCLTTDQPRESIYSVLRSRLEKKFVADITLFDVPLNMRFGSFDDLIRLADDLSKYDTLCEQVLRRIERETLDIDRTTELRIFFQRNTLTMEQYLRRFVWDEAKYPKARLLRDNLELLMSSVKRISEDVHIKSLAYNEAKQMQENVNKSDGLLFSQKDLTEVLTPSVVEDDDFIETEHLTTVVVMVPPGTDKKWVSSYHTFAPFVVPESTRKFNVMDCERNTLWRVVLFKKYLEDFKNNCKADRFHVCDFKYNPSGLAIKLEERSRLSEEKDKQESFMTRVCLTSFSEAFISWMHLKVIRVYIEGVLRYGLPACFSTFLLKPLPSKQKKLKKELHEIVHKTQMFGTEYVQDFKKKSFRAVTTTEAAPVMLGEEDAYYSYILYTFVPFQFFTQA